MADVPFATVTDPLSLDTNLVQCIDEGGLAYGELSMQDLPNSSGGQLQGDARTLLLQGTVRYNPKGALTTADSDGGATVATTALVKPGDTKNGYYILAVKPTRDNTSHSAIDVTARKHVNGTYTDGAVE